MCKFNRFIVKVNCPLDHILRPLEIGTAPNAVGKNIPLPLNGCDNYHNSNTCEKCLAAITLMLFEGEDFASNEVITPDFSKLK